MPQFSVNPGRLDPYKNFKFRVMWDGHYVAGISRMSGLRRTTEVIEHREGGDPSTSHKSPGLTHYEAITLERGVTHDEEFERWANLLGRPPSGAAGDVSLAHFRKDVIIQLINEAGMVVKAFKVYRCWPSEYQALPDLEANGNAVAIETRELHQHRPTLQEKSTVKLSPSFAASGRSCVSETLHSRTLVPSTIAVSSRTADPGVPDESCAISIVSCHS